MWQDEEIVTKLRLKKKNVGKINQMRTHWKVLHLMSSSVRAAIANTINGVASKNPEIYFS